MKAKKKKAKKKTTKKVTHRIRKKSKGGRTGSTGPEMHDAEN